MNVFIYPAKEFRAKVKQGTAFLERVKARPKLYVVGDDRELARLAR